MITLQNYTAQPIGSSDFGMDSKGRPTHTPKPFLIPMASTDDKGRTRPGEAKIHVDAWERWKKLEAVKALLKDGAIREGAIHVPPPDEIADMAKGAKMQAQPTTVEDALRDAELDSKAKGKGK